MGARERGEGGEGVSGEGRWSTREEGGSMREGA